MDSRRSPSRLRALATRWSLIGMMLIALARDISLAHKQRGHWGIAKAEMLEAAIYCALMSLSRDIADHGCAPNARSPDDEAAFRHLKTVHAMLGVTALLVRQLRVDLALIAERWQNLSNGVGVLPVQTRRSALVVPAFLDSG